jgi:hypothetical protein
VGKLQENILLSGVLGAVRKITRLQCATVIDLGVARRLRSLAAEFQAKAEEVEVAESDFSDLPVGRGGSSSGDVERH